MTNHPAKEKKEQEKEESIEDSSPRVTAMLPEDPLQLVTSHIYLNLLLTKDTVNNNSPFVLYLDRKNSDENLNLVILLN